MSGELLLRLSRVQEMTTAHIPCTVNKEISACTGVVVLALLYEWSFSHAETISYISLGSSHVIL